MRRCDFQQRFENRLPGLNFEGFAGLAQLHRERAFLVDLLHVAVVERAVGPIAIGETGGIVVVDRHPAAAMAMATTGP